MDVIRIIGAILTLIGGILLAVVGIIGLFNVTLSILSNIMEIILGIGLLLFVIPGLGGAKKKE